MATTNRILKNFSFLTIALLVGQGCSFAALIYLARVLGATNFGKINFALAILNYFILFTTMGMPVLGAREVARDNLSINKYVSNIIIIQLILSLISFALIVFISLLIDKPTDVKILIMVFGISLFPTAILLEWVFQGSEKMEYIGISRIISKIAYLILVVVFIKSTNDLLKVPVLWFVGGNISGSILAAGYLFFEFYRKFGRIDIHIDITFWKNLLKQAFPVGISDIFIVIYNSIGIITLGFILGEKAVGHFSASYKVVIFFIAFSFLYVRAIFPVLSRYFLSSKENYYKLIRISMKLILIAMVPIAISGVLMAMPIIEFLYGDKYVESNSALRILILLTVLSSMFLLIGHIMLASNMQGKYFIAISTGTILTFLLCLILIPHFGILGACTAMVFGRIVNIFIMIIFLYRMIKNMFELSSLIKVAIAGSAMALHLLYIGSNMNLILAIIIGVLLYLTILLVTKCFNTEELAFLKQDKNY